MLATRLPSRSVRGVSTRSARRTTVVTAAAKRFPSDWLMSEGLALPLGFVGWTVPASIPSSAYGGSSLFSSFTGSIGAELAHFPTGPALTDDFWILFATYHLGLFVTITLGKIGITGRKQGYW